MSPDSRLIYGTLSLERQAPAAGARLVHAALAHGITILDTAPLYGLGAVEQTIGTALREAKGRAQIATKCGIRWDQEYGARLFEASVGGSVKTFRCNGLPASVREEVHASLRRLGVDCVDIVQVHQHDASVPVEDTLGELDDLRRQGKLGAIGVSNFPLPALQRAARFLGAAGRRALFCTQDEYNAVERRAEPSLAFAREHGVQFWAYSPLAGGALTGRYSPGASLPSDHRAELSVFEPANLARLGSVLQSVARPLARGRGVSLAQLVLAWLLCRPGVSAAIVGGSTEEQLAENAACRDILLSPAEVEELDRAFEAAAPHPARRSLFDRLGARVRRALGKASA